MSKSGYHEAKHNGIAYWACDMAVYRKTLAEVQSELWGAGRTPDGPLYDLAYETTKTRCQEAQ